MAYKQLVRPDLSITERVGWCLSFARRAFGAPVVESNAWGAWERAKHKHTDRNFPKGVSFPVWFDWSGNVLHSDGEWRHGRYGHVAVLHTDGRVYSSPFMTNLGREWFASVDDLIRAFMRTVGGNIKYVGWSEDISGVKVIKEEGMNENHKHDTGTFTYRGVLHREPESVAAAKAMGGRYEKYGKLDANAAKGIMYAQHSIMTSSEWKTQDRMLKEHPKLKKRVAELEAQLAEMKGKDDLITTVRDGFEKLEKAYKEGK